MMSGEQSRQALCGPPLSTRRPPKPRLLLRELSMDSMLRENVGQQERRNEREREREGGHVAFHRENEKR